MSVQENVLPTTAKPDNLKVTDFIDETDKAASENDIEEDVASVTHPSGRRTKQTRMEKKSRKALSRFGLKPVDGIVKITIRKSKHLLFSITNPEVFKCPTSDIYIIFGDAKIDDGSSPAASTNYTLPNFTQNETPTVPVVSKDTVTNSDADEEVLDTSDVEERDIQLVMTQCKCTRKEAVMSLRKNNNDLVESIMSFSNN